MTVNHDVTARTGVALRKLNDQSQDAVRAIEDSAPDYIPPLSYDSYTEKPRKTERIAKPMYMKDELWEKSPQEAQQCQPVGFVTSLVSTTIS